MYILDFTNIRIIFNIIIYYNMKSSRKIIKRKPQKKSLKRHKRTKTRSRKHNAKRSYKKGGETNRGNPWSNRCKNDPKYTDDAKWTEFISTQTDWKMLQNEYNKCCPHVINPVSPFGKFKGIPNQTSKCKQMKNLVDKLWKEQNKDESEIIIPKSIPPTTSQAQKDALAAMTPAQSETETEVLSEPKETPQATMKIPYAPPKKSWWQKTSSGGKR